MIVSTNVTKNEAPIRATKPQIATTPVPNLAIAAKLREFAELLEQQGADGFRENAYRAAADEISKMDKTVAEILASDGRKGLIALPTIGKSIAAAIAELVMTGRWAQLGRLRGNLSPERLFMTIPGIGRELARRFSEDAHLETLEDLEAAVHLGNVAIKGLGPRRKQAIAAVIAERLGRPIYRYQKSLSQVPGVELILQVDEMYRTRAAEGTLRTIAPKRFNPSGEQWLPIMHARHDYWHFTALFSNTQLAHKLNKTNDWVVITYQSDGAPEGRCTVVTETRGDQVGKRVVRARESECANSCR